MKAILAAILGFAFAQNVSTFAQGGAVNFYNFVPPSSFAWVTDVNGSRLSGTNFWAQLYSAPGLTATEAELLPAGTPVNFKTGSSAGIVQTSGSNALGQPVNRYVQVTPVADGPASVQMRAWSGPFTSFEAAKSGGGRYGESRVFRITPTGGNINVAPYIGDADGPIESLGLVGEPLLSINDVVLSEGTNGNINAALTVTLSPACTQSVTVAYSTGDGTATAGSDFIATNGILTFLPGQTNKFISVALTPDPIPEPVETFSVILSNATNAGILRGVGNVTIALDATITGLSVDVGLTFTTQLNRIYVLEKNSNPQVGDWTPVSGATYVIGTGGSVVVYDKGAGCSGGVFYRIRIVQ